MPCRKIEGLRWAQLCARPSFAKQSRARGAKRAGLHYEGLVAEAIPGGRRGLWFKFEDRNGPGWASPDLVLGVGAQSDVLPTCFVAFEVKLTFTEEAFGQLNDLYLPILRHCGRVPVFGVVVCRNLTAFAPKGRVATDLATAIAECSREIPILHWLGKAPLWPSQDALPNRPVRTFSQRLAQPLSCA